MLAALIRGSNASLETVRRRAWAVGRARGDTTAPEEVTAAVTRAFEGAASMGPRVSFAPHAVQRLAGQFLAATTVPSTLDGNLQRLATQALQQHLLSVR